MDADENGVAGARQRARKLKPVEAEALLLDARKRGMTLAAYARHKGLNAHVLYGWKTRLADWNQLEKATARPEKHGTPKLLPAVVGRWAPPARVAAKGEARSTVIEVMLASGHKLRVAADFDEAALRRLLAVLESLPC